MYNVQFHEVTMLTHYICSQTIDPELIHHRQKKKKKNYVQSHQSVFTSQSKMQTTIEVRKKKSKSRHQKIRIPLNSLIYLNLQERNLTIKYSSWKNF